MPFQERSMVSQREEFCRLARSPGVRMRELCRRFGISPTIGYKWLGRYDAEGAAGLVDRSRRPSSSPGATPEAVQAQVLTVRREHPCWGGRKIRRVLQNEGVADAPAASTITAILRRHQLLDGPGAGETLIWRRFEYPEPNALWQMDYKGHIATDEGRCHPLTVLDDHSRYALAVKACADEQGKTVRTHLEETFTRYGLPWCMLADNGSPWGAPSSSEPYSRLSIWLMDLGVGMIHGKPRHPQTQGKDERFHRTLKAEAIDGHSFTGMAQAQAAFDRFRHTYNTRRPHEGIGLQFPPTATG